MQKFSMVGLSYGGFVGYSMAAQFMEAVERVVICCAGVCMEEKDLIEGVFAVSDLEEAGRILVPRSPGKLRELVGYAFFRPPPVGLIPSCFLADFIDVSALILSSLRFSLFNSYDLTNLRAMNFWCFNGFVV